MQFFITGIINRLNDIEIVFIRICIRVCILGCICVEVAQSSAMQIARHVLFQHACRRRRIRIRIRHFEFVSGTGGGTVGARGVFFQLRKHGGGGLHRAVLCLCQLFAKINVEPLAAVLNHVFSGHRFQVLELHRPLVAIVAEHLPAGIVRHDDVALRRGLAHVAAPGWNRRIGVIRQLVVLLEVPVFKCGGFLVQLQLLQLRFHLLLVVAFPVRPDKRSSRNQSNRRSRSNDRRSFSN